MKVLALDIETIGLKPHNGVIWMVSINDGANIKVFHDCNGLKSLPKNVVKQLEDKNVLKVIHYAVFDVAYVKCVLGIDIRNVWDTKLCETILNGHDDIVSNSLSNVLKRYGFTELNKETRQNFVNRPFGIEFTSEELEYAKNDVKYLIKLQKEQHKRLKAEGLLPLAELENACVEKIARMKAKGIYIDKNVWMGIYKKARKEYDKLLVDLSSQFPGVSINWNSEKQVKRIFKARGIDIKTLTELDEVLDSFPDDPILNKFIQLRRLYRAVTAYGEEFLKHVDADSRIRSDFTPIVSTGRMASKSPNIQNIPSPDKLPDIGSHRSAFKPSPGNVFVIGDFSGQEIGIMAAASKEPVWLDALLKAQDVHSITAAQLFKEWESVAQADCTFPKKCKCPQHVELRHKAKVLNFMLAYGGGSQKFMKLTKIKDEFEAKRIIYRYKKILPKLMRWLDDNAKEAIKNRVVFSASPFKRKRVLKAEEDWKLANAGKNTPIQAAGADMLKQAMVNIPDKYDIVLVVHDEIILEVSKKEADKAKECLKASMEAAADYVTGIKGLIKVEPIISNTIQK